MIRHIPPDLFKTAAFKLNVGIFFAHDPGRIEL